MPSVIHRACHAKINLSLAVGRPYQTGLENAGLHPICSWMACIELHDELTLCKSKSHQSTYDLSWADGSPVQWALEDDLTVRAHRAMEKLVGKPLPVDLVLRKSIPAGGGLGGGSSDAAGVLETLVTLFDLRLSAHDLAVCARQLGSDVFFFLDNRPKPRPAIVSGVGNLVERFAGRACQVMLILPPKGCETGAVYRAFDAMEHGSSFEEASQLVRKGAIEGDFSRLHNDLRPAARSVYPWLAEIEDQLGRDLGATVHLSGSGSTLYLINPSGTQSKIERIVPSCRVICTKTL